MPEMLSVINPGWVMIALGAIALFIPFKQIRQPLTIIAPVIAIVLLSQSPQKINLLTGNFMGMEQVFYRVDNLNYIFALAFSLAALLNAIYAWHTDNRVQDGMATAYAGAAIAAATCGDFLTLFVFWELTAITSVFMILQAGTRASYFAAMRYLGVQILSGVLLLAGLVYVYQSTGDISLRAFTSLNAPGALLIFFALGIKAAFPFMHNWLQDSYPKATVTGAVILSAFTTKLAVYAFARLFPGHDPLIWIGAVMTIFPVFFAVIENDLRKVLAYSLNNQVGFMICAIGIGTAGVGNALAMNGAAAHAFAHIIYKALLFMSMGAVLYRTGTTKASELGGLYKSMPWTTVFCIIGAMSISAFPFFSGFAAKSMTMSAVGQEGLWIVWLMLLFASAGVLEHSGIKIPYFAFFSHDSGKRVKEAPFNMLLAMGIAAFICIAIGIPNIFRAFGGENFGFEWLYSLVPNEIEAKEYAKKLFEPYHVLQQMQLLILAIFAFQVLKRFGWYPPEKPGTILDTDWIYRKLGFGFASWAGSVWAKLGPAMTGVFNMLSGRAYDRIESAFSPRGELSRGPLTGSMAIWTAAILGLVLFVAFTAVR